ncbi:MAG: 6-bladed beta-propeller [Planctomycetota bacterium]
MKLRVLLAGVCLAAIGCPPPSSSTDPAPDPAGATPDEPQWRPVAPDPAPEGDPTSDQRPPPGTAFPLERPYPQPEVCSPGQVPPHAGRDPLAFWLGASGTGPGQFQYPRALTTDPEGNLFVVDKAGRLQKFDPEGNLLAHVHTPAYALGKPTGLSWTPQGKLLAADTHYARILVYDGDLQLERAWGVPGWDPGQFLFVTFAFETQDGELYTTDYGDEVARVQVWTADGTYLRSWGTFGEGAQGFRRPSSVWVHPRLDEVYVADAANHRVAVFTRQGEHLRDIGRPGRGPGELGYPYEAVLDDEDRLWVAEFGNHRISVFTREGEFLASYGRAGRALGDLNRPWGMALGPEDRLWILDSGNDRVYATTWHLLLDGHR